MIQLNLLPDIKLQYLKTQRLKRIVILASMGATAASIATIIVLSFVVFIWDKATISDLTGDIKSYTNQLGDVQELNKALTIQYQLNSLKTLHDTKPQLSRINAILLTVVPNDVLLTTVNIDVATKSITVNGQSTTLERANTLADSLKFAYYTLPNEPDTQIKPFSGISVTSDFGGKGASVSVAMTYDPTIFDRTKDVKIQIEPGKITTRSFVEKPNPLFIKATEKKE